MIRPVIHRDDPPPLNFYAYAVQQFSGEIGYSALVYPMIALEAHRGDREWFNGRSIDYRFRLATAEESRIAITCEYFSRCVLVRRFDNSTRVAVAVPLNSKARRLCELLTMYNGEASEFRIEQGMSRLWHSLWPWRIRDRTFRSALARIPRVAPSNKSPPLQRIIKRHVQT
jgi:hypothetical protein